MTARRGLSGTDPPGSPVLPERRSTNELVTRQSLLGQIRSADNAFAACLDLGGPVDDEMGDGDVRTMFGRSPLTIE